MANTYSYKFEGDLYDSDASNVSIPSMHISGHFVIEYAQFNVKEYNITVGGVSITRGGLMPLLSEYPEIGGFYTLQGYNFTNGVGSLHIQYKQSNPNVIYASNFVSHLPGHGPSDTYLNEMLPVTVTAVPCFATGTQIRTSRGDVAVEDLRVGDVVVTASGAQRPIRWIGHRLVEASEHAESQAVWPVRITAGAIAMGVPARDLLVSPDHCLFFDDVLVPAKHIINGSTIRQEPVEAVGYWHIELDSHEALLAEGAPAESYRDCGMHAFFEGAEGWGTRVGDKAPVALLASHALSGPRLHGVKAMLIARAKHLGARRVEDPGLQVVADGRVLTPVSIENRRFTFAVPEGTQVLVLRSRSSVPAHWIADNEDRRTLGVRVSKLHVDGTAVAMTDEQLSEGWNAVEHNGQERWTDGEAYLPVCRELSFEADWFLGYPVETVSAPVPVNATVSFAAPVLRLVANG